MKPAREVAGTLAGEHDSECPAMIPDALRFSKPIPGLYDCECGRNDRIESIASAIEEARREGAEDVRERAAKEARAAVLDYGPHLEPVGPASYVEDRIRALPLDPK